MPKMIQIRNVPDDLHALLKQRAADAGQPLSDYLKSLLEQEAELARREALVERIRSREPIPLPKGGVAAAIRAARRERERQLDRVWQDRG